MLALDLIITKALHCVYLIIHCSVLTDDRFITWNLKLGSNCV